MRILINTITTKKRSGGAFQIANNFILKSLTYYDVEWIYVVSADLDEVLPNDIKIKENYFVFPTQPDFNGSYYIVKKQLRELEQKKRPDVVYSITAPSYFSFNTLEVMRFTNPWVTHPNKYAWSVLSLREKIHYFIYGLNQKRLMKRCHYFITQTETCAMGICRITNEPLEHIKVVNNVLPSVYRKIDNTPVKDDDYYNIACVGAATTHKNFDIIPEVLRELKALGVDNVRIHITLPNDEPTLNVLLKKTKRYELEDKLINHGRLSQVDLGEMYRRCQLCFLPTLLEVFSASAIEAMYFKLPVVATDFSFNTEVFADSCLYYEPKNAKQAALQIKRYIDNTDLQEEMKQKMKLRLKLYGDYDKHFNDILDFLKRVGKRG